MSSSSLSSMENELTKATHYVGVSGLDFPVEGLANAYNRRRTNHEDANNGDSSGDMGHDLTEEDEEEEEEEEEGDEEEMDDDEARSPRDSFGSGEGEEIEEDLNEDVFDDEEEGEVEEEEDEAYDAEGYYEDEAVDEEEDRLDGEEEDFFPEVDVAEEGDYMDRLPEEEHYFPVSTPTADVDDEPGPLTSPFSPTARRSREKRRRFDFGEQRNVEWSLMPCRKVSVVVRVKPPLLKFGGLDDSTMYVLTDADVQALSYGTPSRDSAEPIATTAMARQPATPRQQSSQTPAVCLFPLLATDDPSEKVDDPSEYPARTRDMIVVNPSAFGDYIPSEVTMEAARMVAQVAQITSEDWARHYRFDDVLWPDGFGAPNAGADAGWHLVPSSAALVDAASAAADDAVRRDINSAFFTMGARDSGGSYTMFGSSCITTPVNSSEAPSETFHRTGLVGVVASTVLGLLAKYHDDGQGSAGLLTMSMIEIVDEDDLRDCLRWGGNAADGRQGKEVPLRIRHPDHQGAIVQDVLEVPVESLDHVEELLLSSFESVDVRDARKKEGGRGHIIITLKVHLMSSTNNGNETLSDYHNTVQLVDLAPTDMDEGPAGDKRTSSIYQNTTAQTEKLHDRRVASIRKSLSGLRGILRTLIIREVQGKSHQSLTYRECTLTKLLQRTLDTPSSRAVLVATVCSRREAYERTLSTLNYIHRLLVRKGLTARSPFGGAADSKRLHHALNASAIKQHFANDENALYKMMLADPRQRLAGYLAAASVVPGDEVTPVATRPALEPQPSQEESIPSPADEPYDAVIAKLDALHKTPEPRFRQEVDPDIDDGDDEDYPPTPSNPSDHPEEVLVPGSHDPNSQELVPTQVETPRDRPPSDPVGDEPTPASLDTPDTVSPGRRHDRPLLLDGPQQVAAMDPPEDDILPVVPRKEPEEWRHIPAHAAPLREPRPHSVVPVLAPKVAPPEPLPKPKPPMRMDSDSTTDTDNTSSLRNKNLPPNPFPPRNPFPRLRGLGSYPLRAQRLKDLTAPRKQVAQPSPNRENGPAMTTQLEFNDGPNDEAMGRDSTIDDSLPPMTPGSGEEPEGDEPYHHQGRLPAVGEDVPSPAAPPPSQARHSVSSTTERSYVEKHYTTTSRATKKEGGLAAFLNREGDRSRGRRRESGGSYASSKEEYDRPSDGDSRDTPQRERDISTILSRLASLEGDIQAVLDVEPESPSNPIPDLQDPSAHAPSSTGFRDSPSDYSREFRYARSPSSNHATSPTTQERDDGEGRDRLPNSSRKVSFAPSADASPRNSDHDTNTHTQMRLETHETPNEAENAREQDARPKISRYTDSDGRTVRLPSRLGRMVDELVAAKQILEDDLVSRMQKESEREALKKELEKLRLQVSQARRSKDSLERDLRSLSHASAEEVSRLQERLKRLREEHKTAAKEQLHQKNLETENLLLQNEVENITRDLNEALKGKEESERRQRDGFKESLDLKRNFENERRTLKETIEELREKCEGRDTESFLRDLKRMDEENRIEHTARRKAEDRLLDMEAQKERAEQRVEELQELMEAMDDENKSTVEDLTARQTASDELLNSQLREILDLLRMLRPNLDRRFYDEVLSSDTKDSRSVIRRIKEELRDAIANKKDQAAERAQAQARLEAQNHDLRKELDKLRREAEYSARERSEVLQEMERLREHAAQIGEAAPSADHSELLRVLTTPSQETRRSSDNMREQMQWLKESMRLSLERIKDDYRDALRATREGAMAQAEDQLKDLRNRLEAEKEARRKAEDQLKEMDRQIRRLVDSRQAEINKLGEEHDAVIRSSVKQIGELTSRVSELEKEKAALEGDLTVVGKELEQANTEKKELETEMQRLRQKLRDAEQNATEAARRNDVLQEAVDELRRSHDAEVEALRQDLISLQNTHEKLRKTHITEMERLESALVDSEAQRDGLHKELEAKTAQLERLAAKGRNDLSTLEKKFKEKLAHMERTQNDLLAEKGRQLDELREKNAALARELGATKDALTKARVDKMNTDNNESRLRSLIKELEENLKEADGKGQQLERSLGQSEGEASRLRRDLGEREERHTTVVKDLDDELQRLRDGLASKDGEVESLEDKLGDVSRELAECQKALDDANRNQEAMVREMQELGELCESNERYRETIEELNRNYSVMQEQSDLAQKRAAEENERKLTQLQDSSAAKANILKEQISSLLRDRESAEEALKTLRDVLEKETDAKKELEREMDELRESVERYHRSMEEMKKDVLSIQKKANESVTVIKRKWKQAETRHETALDDVRLWATTTISGLTSQLRVANETIRRLGSKRVREQPVYTDENGMPIRQLGDGRNGTEYTEEETIRRVSEEETIREDSEESLRRQSDGGVVSEALSRERTLRQEAEEVAAALAARAKACFEEKNAEIAELKTQLSTMQEEHNTEIAGLLTALSAARRYRDFVRERAAAARTQLREEGGDEQALDAFKEIELCDPPLDVQWQSDPNTSIVEHESGDGNTKDVET